MLSYIDNFLNKITMYRLVLYYLIILISIAVVFCFIGILPYNPIFFLLGTLFILSISMVANFIFAKIFKAPVNAESFYISALILVLVISPLKSFTDIAFINFASWSTFWTIASKFVFAIKKKHVFNPVAIGLVISMIITELSASWWIGTASMLPFVLIGGFLIAKKTLQNDLVWSFLITGVALIFISKIGNAIDLLQITKEIFLYTPIIFFGTVMLTEPITAPPKMSLRIIYGILVGFLYAPFVHIGSIYGTPEIALVIGNIFSYIVSPKIKLFLKLKEKNKLTSDTYEFAFENKKKIQFKPGQYLEWTLEHDKSDSRGNRRYFTIASSPTEDKIKLGVKFYDHSSSYKKALLALDGIKTIAASQLSGEFTIPKDKNKKLVFIAGGIGITPFRSIIKYLMDTNEKRDVTLVYSNATKADIAYKSFFDSAALSLGIKVIYVITREDGQNENSFYYGHIDEKSIREIVPDFNEKYFYISGTHAMVNSVKNLLLKDVRVKNNQIKIDFFPGFV